MFLRPRTASTASTRVSPSLIMRKASVRVAERLTPRAQWTSTLPARTRCRMASNVSLINISQTLSNFYTLIYRAILYSFITPLAACVSVVSPVGSYLPASERYEWNRPSRWRTGSSQTLYSLLLRLHDTVCRCLRRSGARCQCAAGHLRHSPYVLLPDPLTGSYPEPWPCGRHGRRHWEWGPRWCFLPPPPVSICVRTHHRWLKCTDFLYSSKSAGQNTGVVCSDSYLNQNQHIAGGGPEVRMSLTHLRRRGWAKPRWQLRWGVCSSAEGRADRRWAVFDTLAPPLGSYLHISLHLLVDDYHKLDLNPTRW